MWSWIIRDRKQYLNHFNMYQQMNDSDRNRVKAWNHLTVCKQIIEKLVLDRNTWNYLNDL